MQSGSLPCPCRVLFSFFPTFTFCCFEALVHLAIVIMIIDGQKWSCDACVRGHRVTTCKHHGMLLLPS